MRFLRRFRISSRPQNVEPAETRSLPLTADDLCDYDTLTSEVMSSHGESRVETPTNESSTDGGTEGHSAAPLRQLNRLGLDLPPELVLEILSSCSRSSLVKLCTISAHWRAYVEQQLYASLELFWDARPDRSFDLLRTLVANTRIAALVKRLNVVITTLRRSHDIWRPMEINARETRLLVPRCAKCRSQRPDKCEMKSASSRPSITIWNAMTANGWPDISSSRPSQPLTPLPDNLLQQLASTPAYFSCGATSNEDHLLLWTHLVLSLRACVNIESVGFPRIVSSVEGESSSFVLPRSSSWTPLEDQCLASLTYYCQHLRAARLPYKLADRQMFLDTTTGRYLYRPNDTFATFIRHLRGGFKSIHDVPASESHLLVLSGYDRAFVDVSIAQTVSSTLTALADQGQHLVLLDSDSRSVAIFPGRYRGERLAPYLHSVRNYCELFRGEDGDDLVQATIHLATDQLTHLREIFNLIADIRSRAYKPKSPLDILDLRFVAPTTQDTQPSAGMTAQQFLTVLAPLENVGSIRFMQDPQAGAGNVLAFREPELLAAARVPWSGMESLQLVQFRGSWQ